jgi:hypothetical protein
LRKWAIAVIIALTTTLAPLVRADILRFIRTVFARGNTTPLVQADVNK